MRSLLPDDEQNKSKHPILYLVYLLLVIGNPTGALAQTNTLHAVLEKIIEQPVASPSLRTSAGPPQAYLVQLKAGIRKEQLTSSGISILRVLNRRLYIVQATQETASDSLLENIWPVNSLWKLSDDLLLGEPAEGQTSYTVKVKDTSVTKRLASIPGIKITYPGNQLLTICTSLEVIKSHILPLEEVVYVGKESTLARPESPVLDLNLQPNAVNRIHHAFPHLTGQGMVISIQEHLYRTDDLDLRGRHISSPIGATQESKHATEMATIAAGAGNSFVTGKGVAPAASITSSDFDDLLPDADEHYALLKTWVQNHSYGTVIENLYGTRAEAFDASANRNPTLLHVFSSGNEGHTTPATGAYQGIKGFATITGNFKMSKNTLTVGCVDTVGRPMPFSSRGPAYDGRIKPEVVAYSTAGSSNAAALVSGISVLLQQAYLEQHEQLPPSALLKALLINSATDAGPAGLDHITGYGNIDGYRALTNLMARHYFTGKVSQGEKKTFELHLPANACRLKVTAVWNDPAAAPNANTALVHDLDMQLTDSQGKRWLPWVLHTSADAASLSQPAFRAADRLNNIEQISLDSLSAGTYTITIEGYDISAGSQEFYMAYQWDTLQTFEWTSPTASDNMPYNGETDTYFTWKSTLPDTVGRLEYSIDGGRTWQGIADSVQLKKGYYRWKVPTLTAIAQARMVAGSTSYTTGSFTISHPLTVSVGYNCADSLLLSWLPVPGATQYELLLVEENTLKPVLVTADTLLAIQKNRYPAGLLSLQPVIGEGIRGIRSPVFNFNTLPSSCFLVSFHAESTDQSGIHLVTQLGTPVGVERVIFEREKNGIYTTIGSARPQNGQVIFIDTHPDQGLNRYRTRVLLANGHRITSETATSYYLTDPPVMVFPNPVANSGKLHFVSSYVDDQKVIFRLYRTDGIAVLSTTIFSNRESVSLPALAPGVYLYSIQTDEGAFHGKIIIQ